MVVECVSPLNHQTLQLVMDYITDAVVSTTVLSGRPYVSPDSRHVVTVDDLTGKVSVAGVSNEGENFLSSGHTCIDLPSGHVVIMHGRTYPVY